MRHLVVVVGWLVGGADVLFFFCFCLLGCRIVEWGGGNGQRNVDDQQTFECHHRPSVESQERKTLENTFEHF